MSLSERFFGGFPVLQEPGSILFPLRVSRALSAHVNRETVDKRGHVANRMWQILWNLSSTSVAITL